MVRRLLALVVCYGIVIHAVLTGFAAAAMARGDITSTLCITSDVEAPVNPQHPGSHHGEDCCVLAGCAGFGASGIVPAVELPPILRPFETSRIALPHQAPSTWPSERPRTSRAPPV